MYIPGHYKCNGCGKVRDNDTNHWFIIFPVTGPISEGSFIIHRYHKDLAGVEGAEHFCGQECAMKRVSELMQKNPEEGTEHFCGQECAAGVGHGIGELAKKLV